VTVRPDAKGFPLRTASRGLPFPRKESEVPNISTRILLATLALLALAGCASDSRYREGQNWVVQQEQERRLLQAQGFPQYSCD